MPLVNLEIKICQSLRCYKEVHGTMSSQKGAIKYVKRGTFSCPDCGHGLYKPKGNRRPHAEDSQTTMYRKRNPTQGSLVD